MVLTDGLISYYKCDTNGSFPDAHGSNNGTISGATFDSTGKINGDYLYDGSNDFVNTNDVDIVPWGTNAFTISAWVKFASTSNNNVIVGSQENGGGGGVLFWHNGSEARLGKTGVVLLKVAYSPGAGYEHWVAVMDSSGMRIYVDNVEIVSNTNTGNLTKGGSTRLLIGAQPLADVTTQWFMHGNVDEVAFWDRGLSSTEVSELYNSGDGLQYPFTSGYSNKINGVSSYSKINGVEATSITKVNGVE